MPVEPKALKRYKPHKHKDTSRLQFSGYSFPAGHNRKFLFCRKRKSWICGGLIRCSQFAKFATHIELAYVFLSSRWIKKNHQHNCYLSFIHKTLIPRKIFITSIEILSLALKHSMTSRQWWIFLHHDRN